MEAMQWLTLIVFALTILAVIAGAPALYVALTPGEKEEGRKVSLREFLAWSVPFTLVAALASYVLGMLIWVLPYVR